VSAFCLLLSIRGSEAVSTWERRRTCGQTKPLANAGTAPLLAGASVRSSFFSSSAAVNPLAAQTLFFECHGGDEGGKRGSGDKEDDTSATVDQISTF
jgi:hypothetical protein